MDRFVSRASKLLLGICTAAVLLIVIVFQFLSYKRKLDFLLPNYALVLLLLLLLFLFLVWDRSTAAARCRSRHRWNFDRLSCTLTIVLFVCQFYVACNILFESGWDAGYIVASAKAMATAQPFDAGYFSSYPNNLLLAFILSYLIRINNALGIFIGNQWLMCIVTVNCLINAFTCLLVYRTARLFLRPSSAFIGFLLAVCAFGISPWVVICYSDSLGLMVPLLTFFLYVRPEPRKKLRWLSRGSSLLLGCIGYYIKPTAMIMVLAILLVEALHQLAQKRLSSLGRLAAMVLCIVLSLGAVNGVVGLLCQRYDITLDPERQIGMAHFLMMGANEERDGAFLSEDVEFSSSFSTRSERNQADLQRAISRYRDFTPGRYGRFLARKLLTVYNDGTFAWGAEGTFLSILYPPVNHRISPLLRSIFYYAYSDDQNNGALFPYYALFAQLVWLNILLLSLLSCFVRHPAPHQKAFSILALALIGLTAYEILFEARARYLYLYIPVYCVLAASGLEFCRTHSIPSFFSRRKESVT